MNNNQNVENTLVKPWWGGAVVAIASGVLSYILNEPSQTPMFVAEGFVGGTVATAALNSLLRRKSQS